MIYFYLYVCTNNNSGSVDIAAVNSGSVDIAAERGSGRCGPRPGHDQGTDASSVDLPIIVQSWRGKRETKESIICPPAIHSFGLEL